jgi:hypothetical protein
VLHVVQSQNSAKSSTNSQILATLHARRAGFCEFTSRSSEQWGRATFSAVAGINKVNLHGGGDDEMPCNASDRVVTHVHEPFLAIGRPSRVVCDLFARSFHRHQSVNF